MKQASATRVSPRQTPACGIRNYASPDKAVHSICVPLSLADLADAAAIAAGTSAAAGGRRFAGNRSRDDGFRSRQGLENVSRTLAFVAFPAAMAAGARLFFARVHGISFRPAIDAPEPVGNVPGNGVGPECRTRISPTGRSYGNFLSYIPRLHENIPDSKKKSCMSSG